ncbi:DNA glycosylase, partial [Basidiobolus meristosporus CBS 931.73]
MTALSITFKQTKKRVSPKKVSHAMTLPVKEETTEVPVVSAPTDQEKYMTGPLVQSKHLEHPALKHLIAADTKLGEFISRCNRDCTILEQAKGEVNGFKSLCKSIIYQQISGKAAATIMKRFILIYHPDAVTEDPMELEFPSPHKVLATEVEKLRGAGLSGRKVEYVKDLASKFSDGTIDDTKLRVMDDETLSKTLCTIKGIGPWTVDMFLMFDLRRLDVLPVLDLAVRKSMSLHFGLKAPGGLSPAKRKSAFAGNTYLPTPKEMMELAEHWKPYRSIASWYMWRMTDVVIPE